MASVNFFPYLLLILVLYFASSSASAEQSRTLRDCKFEAIYQLGDSIADTGNLIRENFLTLFARLPYGESFFKPGTGRCSNGLLMIDFIGNKSVYQHLPPLYFFWCSFMNSIYKINFQCFIYSIILIETQIYGQYIFSVRMALLVV